MRNFDFYEFVALIVPGLCFCSFVVFIYHPELMTSGSVQLAGLMLPLGYAIGHLLHWVGNVIERVSSLFSRQSSGACAVTLGCRDFPNNLKQKFSENLARYLDITDPNIPEKDRDKVFAQVIMFVGLHSPGGRVNVFNANYSLFRGLLSACCACAALVVVGQNNLATNLTFWFWLIILALISFNRMRRFSGYYAREVLFVFCNMKIDSNGGSIK
jgi:hypothetical protein